MTVFRPSLPPASCTTTRTLPSLPLGCWVSGVSSGLAIAITVWSRNAGIVGVAASSVSPRWRKIRRVERWSCMAVPWWHGRPARGLHKNAGGSPVPLNQPSAQLVFGHRHNQLHHFPDAELVAGAAAQRVDQHLPLGRLDRPLDQFRDPVVDDLLRRVGAVRLELRLQARLRIAAVRALGPAGHVAADQRDTGV